MPLTVVGAVEDSDGLANAKPDIFQSDCRDQQDKHDKHDNTRMRRVHIRISCI